MWDKIINVQPIFDCKNTLTRIFDLLSKWNQNIAHLFCDVRSRNFNILKKFETKLCEHILHQLRSKSLIHQKNFDLKYIRDILLFTFAYCLICVRYTQCARP